MPKEQKFFIINEPDSNEDLVITDILSSTPEFMIKLDYNLEFPATLEPGTYIEITVIYIPETLGINEGCLFIILNSSHSYIMPFSSIVDKNAYDLEPMFYTDVNVGEQVLGYVKLKSD